MFVSIGRSARGVVIMNKDEIRTMWERRLGAMIQLLQGDVREQLLNVPDQSVHCVVTSPP